MARPTYTPNWDTTVANSSRPASGAQTGGVVDGYTLPAKWLNWMFNNIYLWIVQLTAEIDGLSTPPASSVTNDSSVSGATVKDALNELNKADLVTEASSFVATFPTGKNLTITYRLYESGKVEVSWPALTGMDSSSNHVASGTPIPVSIRPTAGAVRYVHSATGDNVISFYDSGAMNISSYTSVASTAIFSAAGFYML